LPKGTKAFLPTLLEDAAIQQAMASDCLTATQVDPQYKNWRKKKQDSSGKAMPAQHQPSEHKEIQFLITGRMHYSSASAMMTVGQKIMLKREENEHDDKTICVNDTNAEDIIRCWGTLSFPLLPFDTPSCRLLSWIDTSTTALSVSWLCAYCKGVENVSRQLAFRAPFGISGQSIAFASLAPQASEQSTDGFLFGGNKLSEQGKQRQKCVRPCVAVGLFSFYQYILANKRRANLLCCIVSGFPGKQTNQSIKLMAKNISQRTFISIYSLILPHLERPLLGTTYVPPCLLLLLLLLVFLSVVPLK
jgi:hypothetical protein